MGQLPVKVYKNAQYFPFDKTSPALSAKFEYFKSEERGIYSRICAFSALNFVYGAIVCAILGVCIQLFGHPEPREELAIRMVFLLAVSFFLVLAGLVYIFYCRKIILDTERRVAVLGRGPWMLRQYEVPFSCLLGLMCPRSSQNHSLLLLYQVSASQYTYCCLGGLPLDRNKKFFREFCQLIYAK